MKLLGCILKTNNRRHFFSQGIVKLWKSLPLEVINDRRLCKLKERLDEFTEKNSARLQHTKIKSLTVHHKPVGIWNAYQGNFY